MPALKEPHFFSRLRPINEMRYPSTHVSGTEAYLKLFARAPSGALMGEASSSYLWDINTPARIHARNPAAKIIAILRDPVARAYSQYLKDLREGWQEVPFYAALKRDLALEEKGYGISRLYTELGMYSQQVKRYLDTFGENQVKVVLFKNLTSSPGMNPLLLRDIVRFLELEETSTPLGQVAEHENQFAVPRWEWARRLAGSSLVRRIGRSLIPESLGSTYTIKRVIYEPLLTRRTTPPPIDPDAKRWLISIYDPDVTALEQLLKQRLPELRASW